MRGHVGDGDRQEVQHVGERGAVEVAVALDAAVVRTTGLSIADASSRPATEAAYSTVSRAAPVHLGRASQRVGVLHAVPSPWRWLDTIGGVGQQRRQVGRRLGLARVRVQ